MSKFLETGSSSIPYLSVGNLTPGKPVRSDNGNVLVSGLISQSEVLNLGSNLQTQKTTFEHISTTQNPPAGSSAIYFKNDGNPYFKSSVGVETPIASGSNSTTSTWNFVPTITPPPASGELRFDSLTPSSVTSIYISTTNASGANMRPLLQTLEMGDVIYTCNSDNSNCKLYAINDSQDQTTYFGLTVTLEDQNNVANYGAEDVGCVFYIKNNPFDQSLNSSDSVEFKSAVVSDTFANHPTLKIKCNDTLGIDNARGKLDFVDSADVVCGSISSSNSGKMLNIENKRVNGGIALVTGVEGMFISEADNLTNFTTNINVNGEYKHNGNPGLIVQNYDDNYVISSDQHIAIGGFDNVLIGKDCGSLLSGGDQNTLIGTGSGNSIVNGTYNTTVGSYALNTANSDYNTAIGAFSLNSSTGTQNTTLGSRAGQYIIAGDDNTIIGYGTAESAVTGTNTGNTIVGSIADMANGVDYSIALGYGAKTTVNNSMVIGDNVANQTITKIVPGLKEVCSLGATNEEFKDAYFSGTVNATNFSGGKACFTEGLAPPASAAGQVCIYAKTDKKLYYKDSNNLETGPLGDVVTTLQASYNNSGIEPEIKTNTTQGALSIQRGSAADTDHVLEIKNGAGTTTFSVDGNGTLNTADGSAGAPSLGFTNESTTGLYRATTSKINVTLGGTATLSLATGGIIPVTTNTQDLGSVSSKFKNGYFANTVSAPILSGRFADGTVGAPGIAFNGESTTGLYRPSPSKISIALGGTGAISLTTGGIQPEVTNTLDLGTSINRWRTGHFSKFLFADSMFAASGIETNPSISFTNEVGTGLYNSGINELSVSLGGAKSVTFANNAILPATVGHDLGSTSAKFNDLHLGSSIVLSNATNKTVISYTGTEDKTLDLNQISTATSQIGAIIPPTLSVASETLNTEWYVQSSSVLAGGNDTYYAFDGIINNIGWSADIYFPTGTAIADRRYDWVTGIYNTVHPNTVSTVYDGGSVYYGEWIQFRIPDSYPDIQISQYDISQRIIAGITRLTPSIWQLFSSVDGLVWTAEGAEISTTWGAYNIEPTKTIVLSNPTSPGRYFRIAIRQCGVGGSGDKKVPQISELSFTALAGCPANGCLDLTALVKVSDGVDITGNLTAYAGSFSNVLSVATVLQDTEKNAYGFVVMNNKISPPSFIVPSPTGSVLFNAFDPARENSFNMTTSVSGITAQIAGTYKIDLTNSSSADSNGSYDLCIYVDGVCEAMTTSSDLKDTDNNKSCMLIIDLNVGSVVEVRLADASAAITVSVDQMTLVCQRLSKSN